MTRLREALDGLAEEAPPVSLADAAMARYRRGRRARLAAGTVALAAALGVVATMGTIELWPGGVDTAATQERVTVPDLPTGRVGPVAHAYQTPCELDKEDRGPDCSAVEWRVVTRDGRTYALPDALTAVRDATRVPVAISRDGRKVAYYSHDAGTLVVRDLVDGGELTSPVPIPESRIGIGSTLAISDDGRYLAFDPREGSKDPGLLIDLRTGRTTQVPGVYEVVGVKDGVASLVRYRKTDLWLMPVTGGGRPVRFDGVFIMFSELAPDGRTVVAVRHSQSGSRELTVLDARTGRILRPLPVRGLPKGSAIDGTGVWLNPKEVTVIAADRRERYAYAVDVTTGQSRLVADYGKSSSRATLALPGINGEFK
ncbi:hypothetical protein [Nonomuraea sp. NPDC003214]